jgi:hypothetical protein
VSEMTRKKASADWAPLSQIWVELDNPQHPLHCALMLSCEAAVASAVMSGDVPVRGRRPHRNTIERIEDHMTLDAEISVYGDRVTVKLAPPGGAGGATVVTGMRRGDPSIVLAVGPKRVEYVWVEADRPAVEAWIRENALPADRISAAYTPSGEIDPRDTVIRTSDLANLAEERRDSNFDFSSRTPALTSEPTPKLENVRAQPKRDQARAFIQAKFPDGPPSKKDITLAKPMHRCLNGRGALKIDRRTFGRAWDELLAGVIAARA